MNDPLCNVTGKKMYTKDQGNAAVRHLKGQYKGRCVSRWCVFCETYHVTKGLHGKKGRRDFR